jgi:hypothetical protein
MSQTKKIFIAPSPKDGRSRKWEALEELSTQEPYAFVSADTGPEEQYKPEDEGYRSLLARYHEIYPDD